MKVGRIVEYRVEEHNLTGRGVVVEEKYQHGQDGHWTYGVITWDFRAIDPEQPSQYGIIRKVTDMNVYRLWVNESEISY